MQKEVKINLNTALCKMYWNFEFFSGPYFSVFALNTEIYRVKIRTIKNFICERFSRIAV